MSNIFVLIKEIIDMHGNTDFQTICFFNSEEHAYQGVISYVPQYKSEFKTVTVHHDDDLCCGICIDAISHEGNITHLRVENVPHAPH